jgi:DNA-binding PadR family transcriptional regulator
VLGAAAWRPSRRRRRFQARIDTFRNICRLSVVPRRPNRSPQTRLVLDALLAKPSAWQHGYELSKQTGLQSGTLYPLLTRLSEHGLLEHEWQAPETPGRPPRHVYRLTAAGITAARELAAEERERSSPRRRRPGPVQSSR